MAHGTIRFLQHRRPAAMLRAGVGVVKVGNSSMTVRTGLFRGDECLAVGETVLVMTDRRTSRPAPLPQSARAALLEGLMQSAETV